MGQTVEFTFTVHGEQVDRDLATDTVARALGDLGYMVDVHHIMSVSCTEAVAAAVAAEREACAKLARNKADAFLAGAKRAYDIEARALRNAAAALQILARDIEARTSGGNGGREGL